MISLLVVACHYYQYFVRISDALPPHFVEDADWVEELLTLEFPMIRLIAGFGRLIKMCLASLLYHRNWIASTLDSNHIARVTSHCLRTGELLTRLNSSDNIIVVTFPWNDDNNVFTGIPPHIALMHEVTQIKDKQTLLVSEFIVEMKSLLEQMGVDGGRMSETNLRTILDTMLNNFEERFINRTGLIGTRAIDTNDVGSTRVENNRTYTVHMYGGKYKRVPADWRFPRCGISDLWRHWWIGDTVRQIPPLRMLSIADVNHLDGVTIATNEEHGRKGTYKHKRRQTTKTLSDMRFVMNFVQQKVVDKGAFEAEITSESVDCMFAAVVDVFTKKERDAQKQWTTVAYDIRSKKIE